MSSKRQTRGAGLLATAVMLAGLVAAPAAASAPQGASARPVAGSTTGGDPYFPAAGNGGYDVDHYDLRLRYEPGTRALVATARISARTTSALRSFSLDLRGLVVTDAAVDGVRARFSQREGELVVAPRHVLRAGRPFTVSVEYGGTTGRPLDVTDALYGWVSMPDGAFVANEPEGASTWYPVNDVPYDKATYDVAVSVPEGTVAVGNGLLESVVTDRGWTTWTWSADDPQASYLSMAASGDYLLTSETTADGLPIINAVDEDLPAEDQALTAERLALQPAMIDFFTGLFGPYPFGSFGAVVDDDEDAGYALENQTRPIYSGVPSESTIAHELAHQWYGNSVTPRQWTDIWLNEGFAVYAEWLWAEQAGGPTPQEQFEQLYSIAAADGFWSVRPGDPGAEDLFAGAVYDRGAMTLQALRQRIGDDAFFTVLRSWAGAGGDSAVSTADLVRLAEQVSGEQLDGLFDAWLYTSGKPPVVPVGP